MAANVRHSPRGQGRDDGMQQRSDNDRGYGQQRQHDDNDRDYYPAQQQQQQQYGRDDGRERQPYDNDTGRGYGPPQGQRRDYDNDRNEPPRRQMQDGYDQREPQGRPQERQEPPRPQYYQQEPAGRQYDRQGPPPEQERVREQERVPQDQPKHFQGDVQRRIAPKQQYVNPGSGVYVFARFHKNGLADVDLGLKKGLSVLRTESGLIRGIARSEDVRIIDGIQGWSGKTFDKTRMKGDSWRIRSQPSDDGLRSDQCILVMWFPKLDRARAWMDSEFSFKQKDFPSPDGFDSFACPLNYIPENDKEKLCYMLTEYPHVTDADQFREDFGVHAREILAKYGAMPYIVQTVGNKHMRGTWIQPKSVVTVSRFESREQAQACFFDESFQRLRQEHKSPSTTVLFSLSEYV